MNSSGRAVVILLGGPGAGKGTQANFISGWLKIPHISTGQLLRAEVAAKTELGLRAKTIMEAGSLVGDDIVNELVEQRTRQADCTRGFILDGYPRDMNQALSFKRNLFAADRLIVIDIVTDLEKVLPRLTGRRMCSSCSTIYHLITSPPRRSGVCDHCGGILMQRSDDHEDVIRERFKTYHESTEPLRDLYMQWASYRRADGMQDADYVARNIKRMLATEIRFRRTPKEPSGNLQKGAALRTRNSRGP